jgi:cytoskeleton protein RodZ
MSSFGEHLRREREMRGISLDEIMATTKISRRLLQALEDEQFELLPGGIFNKSYVRAYAKCVGIDEEEAVGEYLQAAKETPPDTRVIAHQHASLHSDRRPERSGFPIMPVLVLLVVAIGSVGGWKVYRDRQRDREAQMPRAASVEQSAPAAAAPSANNTTGAISTPQPAQQREPPAQQQNQPQTAAAGTASLQPTGSSPGSQSAATTRPADSPAGGAAAAQFVLTITPKDRAWVSIKADGNYVVRGIIKPPDVRTIRASDEIVFYTGNAGAVEVAFNGKSVPVSGGANDEKVLVFDSHGLQPKAPAQ